MALALSPKSLLSPGLKLVFARSADYQSQLELIENLKAAPGRRCSDLGQRAQVKQQGAAWTSDCLSGRRRSEQSNFPRIWRVECDVVRWRPGN